MKMISKKIIALTILIIITITSPVFAATSENAKKLSKGLMSSLFNVITEGTKVTLKIGSIILDSLLNITTVQNESNFKLSSTSLTIEKGQTKTLSATYNGKTVEPTYKSSNTGIVTVDSEGIITAKANGIATITATYSGKTASCNVNVSSSSQAVTKGTIKRTSVDPQKYNNNSSYPYSKQTGRNWVQYCNNMSGYLEYVEGASEKYNVKPELIMAIIMLESGGEKNNIGSNKGIKYYGLMQISGKYYKSYLPKGKTDPLDPETNIYVGTKMFSIWQSPPYNYSEKNALSRYSGNKDNVNCKYVCKIMEFKDIIQELYTF